MKILKIFLIVVVSIAALVLILAAFTKNEINVTKEVVINKPKSEVFSYIKNIKNQDKYNKWVMADPNVRREYVGTDGTPGFIMKWDSENKEVGKGEQEIKKVIEGDRIDSEVRFLKPFEGKADSYMSTESISADQTKVKWGLYEKMKYPMNLMLMFVDIPEMLGNDMVVSLHNLKVVMEK
ncbi:hypothetical protein BH10BAC5_BH10BAC5_15830 [soil metagenome]